MFKRDIGPSIATTDLREVIEDWLTKNAETLVSKESEGFFFFFYPTIYMFMHV